ncbi:MAG TPA: HEAT repeat domain-containing protein [Candidatus Hydrogenedentes bacterium]|nr:HEAT repeat domain-containing protein [Candidatus Hydrogenedentota bacterium]
MNAAIGFWHWVAGERDIWRAAKMVALILLAALALGCGGPKAKDPYARERDMLQEIGIAFRLYANEHKEYYPPRSAEPGVFQPDMTEFAAYFSDTPEGRELVDYLTGRRGVDLCYLGHLVMDQEAGLTLLARYEQDGAEVVRNARSIPFDEEVAGRTHPSHLKRMVRIKEGVERYFVTDIGNPAAGMGAGALIPVLWEMPDTTDRSGGLVLYMDGHAQWRRYPGEFPMSQRFIAAVRRMINRQEDLREGPSPAPPEDSTQTGQRSSPVYAIAEALLEDLQHGRQPPPWEILRCDTTPTAEVDEHKGYRIVLRRTDIEYSDKLPPLLGLAQEKVAQYSYFRWPIVKQSHIDLVLFPDETDVPSKLRKRIPWPALMQQRPVRVFDLGRGHGYRWFGCMDVGGQAYIRRQFNLSGGDDFFKLALRELRRTKDKDTRLTAIGLLADAGERAIPFLVKEIRANRDDCAERAVRALGHIPGAESTALLSDLCRSSDKDISRAAAWALLHPDLRPEAKDVYLDLLRAKKHAGRISEAVIAFGWEDTKPIYLGLLAEQGWMRDTLPASCDVAVHFGWEEALPLLEAICGNPSHFWEYKTAFEAGRTLEGNPLPDEVKEAEHLIWAQTSCYPENQPEPSAVEEAIRAIAEYADEEVAAIIALKCAIFEGGMICGVGEINKAGRDILEQIPVDVTVPLLEQLIGKLDDERTKRKLTHVLEDITGIDEAGPSETARK